jgi:spore germination protein GerM
VNNRLVWILLIITFFIAGAAGSYFVMRYFDTNAEVQQQKEDRKEQTQGQDFMTVKLFIPKGGKLEATDISMQRRSKSLSLAEGIMEEFFKKAEKGSYIPENVKLLGIYRDQEQTLYLELSDEIRRNFHGDAFSEYMLLKAIYETLASNLQDFQDLKILIDGKETDTLGGHIQIRHPLRSILGSGSAAESRTS